MGLQFRASRGPLAVPSDKPVGTVYYALGTKEEKSLKIGTFHVQRAPSNGDPPNDPASFRSIVEEDLLNISIHIMSCMRSRGLSLPSLIIALTTTGS